MATGDKTPRNGHDDRDFADRLKPSRFDTPVRGGGLAGDSNGTGGGRPGVGAVLLAVLVLLLAAGAAIAAKKLGWLG